MIFVILSGVAISGCSTKNKVNYVNNDIAFCKYENGSVNEVIPCKVLEDVYVLGMPGFSEECNYTIDKESSNIYGIVDSDKIILVEAGGKISFNTLVDSLNQLGFTLADVEAVLLTHEHYDHAYNSWRFQEIGIPIYAHEKAAECIESDPQCNETIFNFPPVNVTRKLKDGDIINFKEKSIEVIYTPDHTNGSISFLLTHGGEKILFCGDICFFNGTFGACSGSFDTENCRVSKEYIESLKKLYLLECDVFLPGHAPHNQLVLRNGNEHIKKCLEHARI